MKTKEDYIEWENQICLIIAERFDCAYETALAIVFNQSYGLCQSWCSDLNSLETANKIIEASKLCE